MTRVVLLSDVIPPPLSATLGGLTPSVPAIGNERMDSPSPSPSTTSSLMIVVIVVASAIIVSASLYLLLRIISNHCNRRLFSAADDVVPRSLHNRDNPRVDPCLKKPSEDLISSLPIFSFSSINGGVIAGGDCAVCLSKFNRNDQLRLLPLCCHAFHVECIDAWLTANQTCPLCRSTVYPTEDDVLNKILEREEVNRNNSFRIQIGSISRRSEGSGNGQRSYSIGSFEYIVDDGYEVPVNSAHRRSVSVDKDSAAGLPVPSPPEPHEDLLAGEVSNRSWLRDYVDRLASVSSRTMSGRFFGGSSRRSDIIVTDLESNRAGEEISELFRWLSGV